MITLLQNDLAKRPDLFHFQGPIAPAELDDWLRKTNLLIPHDLRELWLDTGGGELFETETILSPFGRHDLADDVESVNKFHRQRGMPGDLLVFHTGVGGLSVVKVPLFKYASIREDSYEIRQTFTSLADWYVSLIHLEFAARYELPKNMPME